MSQSTFTPDSGKRQRPSRRAKNAVGVRRSRSHGDLESKIALEISSSRVARHIQSEAQFTSKDALIDSVRLGGALHQKLS